MQNIVGYVIVTISEVLYGTISPLLKKANNDTIPPFTVMAVSMFVLFLCSLIGSIFFEHSLQIKAVVFKSNIGYLILAGLINFVAFWFLILGFKYMPIWQQMLFTLLMPISGALFAVFLLGEKLSVNFFIGLTIMGIGLLLAIR